MPLLLRSWPLLLALGLSACASGPDPSSDACAPAAALLGRQMAVSGVALPREAPGPAEMIAALRLANLHLLLSQEAAARLFECRAAQARAIREDQADGRTWRVTAEFRIARIRNLLRQEIEAALAISERIGAADAALVTAASSAPVAATRTRQEMELRRLAATNTARREGFGATVLLAGQFTDIEMNRGEVSR